MPVAEPVLAELASALGDLDIPFLVIGAAARDLAIHARQGATAVRATLDLDIAVAVDSSAEFEAIGARLPRSPHVPHRFDVLGTEVDVVPFGPVESGRSICFANDHRLDVTGLAEAAATSLPVLLPGGALVRVASPAAQTALKVLAWRDRGHGHSKDALDLFTILAAMSEHPFRRRGLGGHPSPGGNGSRHSSRGLLPHGGAGRRPLRRGRRTHHAGSPG